MSSSYLTLKPLCDALCRAPSIENVAALRSAIESIAPDMLQLMQDFLLVPLINLIDADLKITNSEIKVHLIDTVESLLSRTRLRQLVPFKVLIVIVLKQIFDPERMILIPGTSEELKLASLRCLRTANLALMSDCRHEFHSTGAGQSQHAQIAFVALALLESDRYRRIRREALELLLCLWNVNDEADTSDVELRQEVANRVFTMMPKISKVLLQIAAGDEKEPAELKSRSLCALGRYFRLVFEDYEKGGSDETTVPDVEQFRKLFTEKKPDVIPSSSDKILDLKSASGIPKQITGEWLEAAVQRLRPVFDKLLLLTGSKDAAFRNELSILATGLFETATPTIRKHLVVVLQIIIVLGQPDESNPHIAERCRGVLNSLHSNPARSLAFNEQLDALFHSILITIPRVFATGTDDEQFALLTQFAGLIRSVRLKLLLAAGDCMERFCSALVFLAELDAAEGIALEALRENHLLAIASTSGSGEGTLSPWRPYRHLRSDRTRRAAEGLCSLIGRSSAGEAVFAALLERLHQRATGSNEALLLLQLMLAGDGWAEAARCRTLIADLLGAAEHWDLDVRPSDRKNTTQTNPRTEWYEDKTPGLYESAISIRYTDLNFDEENSKGQLDDRLTIAEARHNVQHICLTLETMGRLARTLRHGYQPFMLSSLFRIIVKCGSPNVQIHEAAERALHDISLAFDHSGGVRELIAENFDYILHSVTMAMRRPGAKCTEALAMLSVLLQFSRLDAVVYWENIVDRVLEASARPQHTVSDEQVLGFLRLLRSFVEQLEQQPKPALDVKPHNERAVLDEWLRILNEPDPEDVEDSPADENDDCPAEYEQPDDAKPEPNVTVRIAVAIVKRCTQYLPHKSRAAQCAALEALRSGFSVLHSQSATDELLPLVHEVWPSFVERVAAGDPIVLHRCFALMRTMSAAARDFMYKRTASDILPLVLRFLQACDREGRSRIRDASFDTCQTLRLTVELLGQMPALFDDLTAAESDLDALLVALLPFLHRSAHRPCLQRAAVECLRQLASYDGAAVYLKLRGAVRRPETADNARAIVQTSAALGAMSTALDE